MPNGTATIVGILPCRKGRRADTAKSRVYAYDADVFLGVDEKGEYQTALARLYYFLPVGISTQPASDKPYYISGKIISVEVEDTKSNSEYDLIIEAQIMHPVKDMIPIQPTVVIGGTVGEILKPLNFDIDIDQYVSVLTSTHAASFEAQSQPGNLRFVNHIINLGSRCVLTGVITGESYFPTPADTRKRIPFEFYDYNFISPAVLQSPYRQGKKTNFYNSPSPSPGRGPINLAPSPPGTPKRER